MKRALYSFHHEVVAWGNHVGYASWRSCSCFWQHSFPAVTLGAVHTCGVGLSGSLLCCVRYQQLEEASASLRERIRHLDDMVHCQQKKVKQMVEEVSTCQRSWPGCFLRWRHFSPAVRSDLSPVFWGSQWTRSDYLRLGPEGNFLICSPLLIIPLKEGLLQIRGWQLISHEVQGIAPPLSEDRDTLYPAQVPAVQGAKGSLTRKV